VTALSRTDVVPRRDGRWLAAIAVSSTCFWLVPYMVRGVSMPIGPDVPVYLWWTRIVAEFGIGAGGHRPGATALVLALSQALGLAPLAVIAGLLVVGGVTTALSGALLLREAGVDRLTWVLGGVLLGLFARFLVWGYLSNLLFGQLFLSGVALVIALRGRDRWSPALLFAGAGLAHPYFYVLGLAIVGLTIVGARIRDRNPLSAELRSLMSASTMGGLAMLVGVWATFRGPRYSLEIAPDAILRESGLRSLLPETYRIQFRALAKSDGLWLLIEAALAIVARLGGVVGRFLGSWAALTAMVLPLTFLLPVFAGQRLVFFAYFLPLLAAVGLARITKPLRPAFRASALAVVVGLVCIETATWWWSADPFYTEEQLAQSNAAATLIAATSPGTPTVVVVSQEGRELVLQAMALNAVRASVPADRIPDVYAYFGRVHDVERLRPTARAEPLRSLQDASIEDLRAVGRSPLILALAAFNDDTASFGSSLRLVSPGVYANETATEPTSDPPSPPGSSSIVGVTILLGLVLVAVGAGFARSLDVEGVTAWVLAPSMGMAGLIVAATASLAAGLDLGRLLGLGCLILVACVGWILAGRRT
jgi:hypothetical protein